MVVNFTPNIGLAKPTTAEIAENWTNFTQLQDDNNLIITDKMDIAAASYSPTVIATTTPPNLGTGTMKVEYWLHQGIVWGSFIVEFFDAGITVGNGEYGFALPFLVDNSFHAVGTALTAAPGQYSCIGEGYIYDSSAIATSGSVAIDAVTIGPTSYARLITEVFTAPAKTSRVVRDSMPFAVANNDRFVFNFCYKWM